jgi:hypothetical protein
MNLPPRLLAGIVGLLLAVPLRAEETNLVTNPDFKQVDSAGNPAGYQLGGNAGYRQALGNATLDENGAGIVMDDASPGGSVSQTVLIDPRQGRALAFRFRGLPQAGFNVPENGLSMTVEFFGGGGRVAYDGKRRQIFPLIEKARRDLSVNGDGKKGGAAVWRNYLLTFYVPFLQVDRIRLTVACTGGGDFAPQPEGQSTGQPARAEGAARFPGQRGRGFGIKRIDIAGTAFLVTDFSLTRLPQPITSLSPASSPPPQAYGKLLPIGGRWFYAPRPGETKPPAQFDHTNAERLFYRDGPNGQCEIPFAGNVTAILHAGDMDLQGNVVTADRVIEDNVTIRFDRTSMILHTHGIPNHPTGRFPEAGFGPGSNPNHIREQDETYYFPLDPQVNPRHTALPASGASNGALNMGPIGVAVNGIVFFNPYDAGRMDATNIMDRCCGHPNQDGQYHYHKYPICINSPWSDEGAAHSPLIGFAFDGFPIYGPYESADVMAKDETSPSALNAFNIHYDPERGWHYHVTPGKFPYVIGGYWGIVDNRDIRPPRGGGGNGPPGGGGFPGGPPGPPPDY